VADSNTDLVEIIDELARLVAFRTTRQRRLFGDRAPRLQIVLDEAVPHRLVGGATVMRE
jgi:hypothetical protein